MAFIRQTRVRLFQVNKHCYSQTKLIQDQILLKGIKEAEVSLNYVHFPPQIYQKI